MFIQAWIKVQLFSLYLFLSPYLIYIQNALGLSKPFWHTLYFIIIQCWATTFCLSARRSLDTYTYCVLLEYLHPSTYFTCEMIMRNTLLHFFITPLRDKPLLWKLDLLNWDWDQSIDVGSNYYASFFYFILFYFLSYIGFVFIFSLCSAHHFHSLFLSYIRLELKKLIKNALILFSIIFNIN